MMITIIIYISTYALDVQSSGYRGKLEINMACCDFGTPGENGEKVMTRSEIEQMAAKQQTPIYFKHE